VEDVTFSLPKNLVGWSIHFKGAVDD
jgi:hypothetical protein